ncbi:MAG: FliH/SctL family protein [Roseateles sp.]|uniref:FliH/SctL family protein n=1 Tax=Roseateles sp. TaxID=1971397 RepID=UPI00403529B6
MNSFMLWHRDPQAPLGIASDRRVLRAAEVPALQDAQQLLDELRALSAQEQARVDQACAQARAGGLKQGLAQAEAQSRAELSNALVQLTRTHEAERQRLQQSVGALALEVFQKLLGELPADEKLARLAAQAARELLPARSWRLQVHPAQVAGLRAALLALDPHDKAGLGSAEIVADAELAETDCRLTTEFGTADAGLQTQVDRLARAWGLR